VALGFIDGFDHYQTSDILQKWTGQLVGPANSISTIYARGTGQGMSSSGGVGRGPYKTVWPSGSATVTVGAACYFIANPASTGMVFILLDGTTEQISVRGDAAGKLTVQRGATVLATSTNVISLNTWYYIELKATISDAAGVIELRVNGSSTGWVPSTGSLDTKSTANAYATGFGITMATGTSNGNYFDDVYALDSSGSVNTTFLGDCHVAPLRPQAAGNYTQWTSNGGANFANVADDPYSDGDISFNQSATANQIDSFVFDDIPAASGLVFGIQHVITAKKDVGAARTFAAFQRSGGVDYIGSTQNAGTSSAMYLDLKETNPATSAAWDVAAINGAEFGEKLLS